MSNLKERYKGISSSALNYFEIHPQYFRDYIDRKLEEDSTPWLELGVKVHMYLLELKKFQDSYTTLDFTKPKGEKQSEFAEYIAKELNSEFVRPIEEIRIEAYKTTYAASSKSEAIIEKESAKLHESLTSYINYLITRTKYKDILSYTDMKYLQTVRSKVKQHNIAKELLLQQNDVDEKDYTIWNEMKILWEHPFVMDGDQKLVCKSVIDKLVIDHKEKKIKLIDLKTSSDLHEFEDKFEKLKYYRQMAFYWFAVEYYIRHEIKDKDFTEYSRETYIVGVQTPHKFRDLPTYCEVYTIKEAYLNRGLDELNKILEELSWHIVENKWEHRKSYYDNNGIDKTL